MSYTDVTDSEHRQSDSVKKLFSVKENWNLLKPYLDDPEIIDYVSCGLGYENVEDWNQDKDSPWMRNYWVEKNEGVYESWGLPDDFQEQMQSSHYPHRSELEWYQWKDGSHELAPFLAYLIELAIPDLDELAVISGYGYRLVFFVKSGEIHYADLLREWESVDELEEYLGKVHLIMWYQNKSFTRFNIEPECDFSYLHRK